MNNPKGIIFFKKKFRSILTYIIIQMLRAMPQWQDKGQDMTKFIQVQINKDNLELGYKGVNIAEIADFNYIPNKNQDTNTMVKIYFNLKNNTKVVGYIKEADLEKLQ